MKRLFPLLIVSLFSLIGCNQHQNEETSDAKYVIEFDDDHFVDVKDIVSDIQIIELDTAMNSILPGITNITIIDDTLYCFSSSKGGFVNKYTMDGKYIGSIKHIGHSHEEWVNAKNMYINPHEKNIIISDLGSMRGLLYNLDGSFINDCKLSVYDSFDILYDKGLFYSQSNLFYTIGEIVPETDHILKVFDKQGKLIEKHIPTTHIGYHMSEDIRGQFSWGCDHLLFSPTLYETVYALDSGKVYPYITYNYKGTKEEFYTDEEVLESLKDSYHYLGEKSYYNGSVLETPEYILRRIGDHSAFHVIYDKKSAQAYTTRFYNASMGEYNFSDYLLYEHPLCYYKGRYYAHFQHFHLGLPDEYLGDNVPEILKPYIEKVRKGQVNQILVSYKINIK